jgi:phosphate starvation-inducible protein PhoH and related proteins
VTEARIPIRELNDRLRLFGHLDRNLMEVERSAGVRVTVEGDDLVVAGEPEDVRRASAVLDRMLFAAQEGVDVTTDDVGVLFDSLNSGPDRAKATAPRTLATTRRGRAVRPRSAGQQAFVDAIAQNTLTFAIGPAGTGKTFLAVVMALAALRAGEVQRIVLSRPAVEAGENLGFLPGDLQQKVDPYLRPLFDALGEILDQQAIARSVERGQIEVAPLAYMRGRTLSESFAVLDEGQNTSREQMKMFLTRIGPNSRMVVCGDITQIDLARPRESGLVHAASIFGGMKDIAVVTLGEADIVRHPLIRKIITAYDTGKT